MAAGGGGTINFGLASSSSSLLGAVAACLGLASAVLLVWIPQVFFTIQLDISGKGDAQRVLLGLITTTSSVMTGTIFLLAHFDGGPLRNVHMGTLVVGAIGTVVLIAHPYRALARACWQRGVADVFHPAGLKQHFGNMVTELGKALASIAEHDVTPSSASAPAAEKTA
jgi:hypothetical protein